MDAEQQQFNDVFYDDLKDDIQLKFLFPTKAITGQNDIFCIFRDQFSVKPVPYVSHTNANTLLHEALNMTHVFEQQNYLCYNSKTYKEAIQDIVEV